MKKTILLLIGGLFLLGLNDLFSQPSGGPYGPVKQKYELPVVKGKIYYVAVDGKKDADGLSLEKPITIEEAFNRITSGDAIVLRGGVYRTGNLTLNQGITIQPYNDEQPVLKGTFIAKDWINLNNGLWKTKWQRLFPAKPANWWVRDRNGKHTPLHRFNDDMVFANGKFLQSVGWEGEVDENSYYIDYDSGYVYIGVNPEKQLIEITAYNICIYRTKGDFNGKMSDHIGPVIRGIEFLQYAYRAIEVEGTDPDGISPESKHGKEVVGTNIENCEISFCSRVAAYLRGDRLTIRNCKISETSTEGIYVLSSSDVLLEKNIFTRNNIEDISGYYPAAVKIFNQCYRVTCRDNLVIDLPKSNGIWYDVGNVDGVFVNNWVENVGNTARFNPEKPWPSENGFFFEISKGVKCIGNVFVNCEQGIWILNSSNAQIYNNTLINSTLCIGRNERSAVSDHFGWHPATGPDVEKRKGHIVKNNLLYGDLNYKRPLLFVWQPNAMCSQLPDSPIKEADNNIFITNVNDSAPAILWSPYKNDNCRLLVNNENELSEMIPGMFINSLILDYYQYSVFKGPEINNYQLVPSFPGLKVASFLPEDIMKTAGVKSSAKYVGAYPIK